METNPDPDGSTFVDTTKPYSPNSFTVSQNSYDLSEWKCRLFGIDNYYLIPLKGKEPNIFWRTMQYILVGNKWSKK